MKILILLLLIFSPLFSLNVFANELEREVIETSTDMNLGAAREEILQKSIRKVSEELTLQLLGKESFEKNQVALQKIFQAESGKYISSYRTAEMVDLGDKTQMRVIMKVSLKNLKDVLVAGQFLAKSVEGSRNQIQILVRNTDGFIMMEALKNELMARFPEMNRLKEKSISNSNIEFTADVETVQDYSENRTITIMNKKAEVKSLSDQTLEITLQKN